MKKINPIANDEVLLRAEKGETTAYRLIYPIHDSKAGHKNAENRYGMTYEQLKELEANSNTVLFYNGSNSEAKHIEVQYNGEYEMPEIDSLKHLAYSQGIEIVEEAKEVDIIESIGGVIAKMKK